MPRYQFVALTEPAPGREAEFEKWYDEQHLADVARVPGIVSASRYKIEKTLSGAALPGWQSLAIYEIEADDPQTVLDEIQRRVNTPEMPLTDALLMPPTTQILARKPG
jgi:hypothetical protein